MLVVVVIVVIVAVVVVSELFTRRCSWPRLS